MDWLWRLLEAGWFGLLDYLAAHVLLCLVPAFFIAGYLSLIPQETVTRYLGVKSPKWLSYPAAAVGGFVLAVCSCTILPLFAGIWKRGAGLGPAVTFLFVGPAINILAISYTGAALGGDIATARLVFSLGFGIGIGLIMAFIFRHETQVNPPGKNPEANVGMRMGLWFLFALLMAVLIVGTLQIDLLSKPILSIPIEIPLNDALAIWHLNIQGAILILLLLLISPIAYKGFNDVLNSFNRWTWSALGLIAVTLLIAALSFSENSLHLTGRFMVETTLLLSIVAYMLKGLSRDELADWLAETWRFSKQIFPLLIFGVFIAGSLRSIIPEDWIKTLAGENTIIANALAVFFGVFVYFPTLVEVPIARMFLDLGMSKGPLLAYLLADPELSLQSILVTGKIMGEKKTFVYVGLVAVFSTLAGYFFGLFLAAFP